MSLENPEDRVEVSTRKVWAAPPSIAGTLLAAFGYAASLTPTLLPRTLLTQVVASAMVTITMYAIGASLEGIVRLVARRIKNQPRPPARSWSRPIWVVAILVLAVAACFTPIAMGWQADQAASVGVEGAPSWALVIILTALVVVALIYLGRGFRNLSRWIGAKIAARWTLNATVRGTAGAIVVTAVIAALSVAAYAGMMQVFNQVNNSTIEGNTQPQSPTRSGSPNSLISWESMGQQGRLFVDQGPKPRAIQAVTRAPALEPIRIFAGVESADGLQAQADLVLADLKRSGGLERSNIIVYTPSDNGTVDPNAAAAAEYITGGDVASVAMQYTVLPSFMSYLLSQATSQEAGTILFNTIRSAIDELPANDRPKLYVYGESLGAFGSQAPFDDGGTAGLVDKVDGALWAGPPSTSRLWDELNRQATGGTAWQPVVGDGTVVRFAADVAAIRAQDTGWGPVRALYLQNPTDPVVWWPGSLLTQRPAWLDSPRGPGVPSQMTWLPLITFEQMIMDLPPAVEMPDGIGHNYFEAVGPAWAAVLQPPDWTPAKTKALQEALAG